LQNRVPGTRMFVILNPTSGGGAGKRIRAEVERELHSRRVDFEIRHTEGPGHATELAAAAVSKGADIIVAAGGDGTIHEVANGLLRTESAPPLGILPVGTGNDFVKVAGVRPRRRVYDALVAGAVQWVDVGHAQWGDKSEYFINGMGTGIDVEVVRQLDRYRKLPTALVYATALARALARFRPIPIDVRFDGERIQQRMMIFTVGNGCCFGGAFRLCPDARPDDGLLDICAVDEMSIPQVLRAMPRVFRGTHTRLPTVAMRQATSIDIAIDGDAQLFFQLDGELREAPGVRSMKVHVVPARLRIITAPAPGAAAGMGAAEARIP
jgi:diacylglycerol kinase (ATP)